MKVLMVCGRGVRAIQSEMERRFKNGTVKFDYIKQLSEVSSYLKTNLGVSRVIITSESFSEHKDINEDDLRNRLIQLSNTLDNLETEIVFIISIDDLGPIIDEELFNYSDRVRIIKHSSAYTVKLFERLTLTDISKIDNSYSSINITSVEDTVSINIEGVVNEGSDEDSDLDSYFELEDDDDDLEDDYFDMEDGEYEDGYFEMEDSEDSYADKKESLIERRSSYGESYDVRFDSSKKHGTDNSSNDTINEEVTGSEIEEYVEVENTEDVVVDEGTNSFDIGDMELFDDSIYSDFNNDEETVLDNSENEGNMVDANEKVEKELVCESSSEEETVDENGESGEDSSENGGNIVDKNEKVEEGLIYENSSDGDSEEEVVEENSDSSPENEGNMVDANGKVVFDTVDESVKQSINSVIAEDGSGVEKQNKVRLLDRIFKRGNANKLADKEYDIADVRKEEPRKIVEGSSEVYVEDEKVEVSSYFDDEIYEKDHGTVLDMNLDSSDVEISSISSMLNTLSSRHASYIFTGTRNSGVTSLAYNVSVVLSNLGFSVLYVDCDNEYRPMSYISKDLFNMVHINDDTSCSYLKAMGNPTNIENFVNIVMPGLHAITMGLDQDTTGIDRIVDKQKFRRFSGIIRDKYDFVMYDMPFEFLLDDGLETAFLSDGIITLTEANTKGLMELLIKLGNIENEEVRTLIFSKASILLNKYSKSTTYFGKRYNRQEQLLAKLDSIAMEITGVKSEYKIANMKCLGVFPYLEHISNCWFTGNAAVIDKEVKKHTLNILKDIIEG